MQLSGKKVIALGERDGVQGAAIAEWGWKKKGWRTAYILLDENIEYDKGICYGFDWMWREKLGGKILGHDVFQNADPSIASQITRIKNLPKEPDVISLCSFVPGGAGGAAGRQDFDLPVRGERAGRHPGGR